MVYAISVLSVQPYENRTDISVSSLHSSQSPPANHRYRFDFSDPSNYRYVGVGQKPALFYFVGTARLFHGLVSPSPSPMSSTKTGWL